MKKTYIIRLDDACSTMNTANWERIEKILDKYSIKPIVGVIPNSSDPDFKKYKIDEKFDDKVVKWEKKGWHVAMHGYNHLLSMNNSGINPVNNKSEFAGLSLDKQREKIRLSLKYFKKINVEPKIFFAPAHTYDINTLKALKMETKINIISDTIANDVYYKGGFYFIPQQSGMVRKLPFKTITYCYHPNNMSNDEFIRLDNFIKKNISFFTKIKLRKRKLNFYDLLLRKIYFLRRMNKK